jgi:hypothetical protein
MNKQFKIIEETTIPTLMPMNHPPTLLKVKCPKCDHIFNQKISGGSFRHIYPTLCPNCNYPREKKESE